MVTGFKLTLRSAEIEKEMYSWYYARLSSADADHIKALKQAEDYKSRLPHIAPSKDSAGEVTSPSQYVRELQIKRPLLTLSENCQLQRPPVEVLTIKTTRTLFSPKRSSSKSLPLGGITANGDSFADAAPFKCLIGRKRKAFYLFRADAKAQSTLLEEKLVIKSEEAQDFGDDEIYLDEDEANFQVFVSWLYHKKLPEDLFTPQSEKRPYKRMSELYGMAHRLGAKHFKNTLMDAFCHNKNWKTISLRPSHVTAHAAGLLSTPLHTLYLQHLSSIIHNLQGAPEETFQTYVEDFQAAKQDLHHEMAAIYHSIIAATMVTCRNKGNFETWAGWGFHEHDSCEEVCYAPQCNERRKKLKAQAQSAAEMASAPATAKDSTSQSKRTKLPWKNN